MHYSLPCLTISYLWGGNPQGSGKNLNVLRQTLIQVHSDVKPSPHKDFLQLTPANWLKMKEHFVSAESLFCNCFQAAPNFATKIIMQVTKKKRKRPNSSHLVPTAKPSPI